MRKTPVAVVVVVFLSSALSAASCVQSPKATPEVDDAGSGAPAMTTRDEGDSSGSDPSSFDHDPMEDAASSTSQEICIARSARGFEARRAFCISAWVPPEKRPACWSKLLLSGAEWIGWCSSNL
jgi:hypothetical protein